MSNDVLQPGDLVEIHHLVQLNPVPPPFHSVRFLDYEGAFTQTLLYSRLLQADECTKSVRLDGRIAQTFGIYTDSDDLVKKQWKIQKVIIFFVHTTDERSLQKVADVKHLLSNEVVPLWRNLGPSLEVRYFPADFMEELRKPSFMNKMPAFLVKLHDLGLIAGVLQ